MSEVVMEQPWRCKDCESQFTFGRLRMVPGLAHVRCPHCLSPYIVRDDDEIETRRILALSDGELRAEYVARGEDPDEAIARVDRAIDAAVRRSTGTKPAQRASTQKASR